jgi:hypothetical protein
MSALLCLKQLDEFQQRGFIALRQVFFFSLGVGHEEINDVIRRDDNVDRAPAASFAFAAKGKADFADTLEARNDIASRRAGGNFIFEILSSSSMTPSFLVCFRNVFVRNISMSLNYTLLAYYCQRKIR